MSVHLGSEADWRALQDLARAALEIAARPEVSPDVAAGIERGADKLTGRIADREEDDS